MDNFYSKLLKYMLYYLRILIGNTKKIYIDMIKLFNYIREYFSYDILPCKKELNPRPLKNKKIRL
jgi:hypothetical protein